MDLPEQRFVMLDGDDRHLDKVCQKLRRLFYETFGEQEASYNIHCVFEHLLQQRRAFGPLSNTSTIRYIANQTFI